MISIILLIFVVLAVISLIKGFIRGLIGWVTTILLCAACAFAIYTHSSTPAQFIDAVKGVWPKSERIADTYNKFVGDNGSSDLGPTKGTNYEADKSNFRDYTPLTGSEKSSTTEGSVKFGATFIMGDLDSLKRATYAHIRVKDSQEPGSNGIKRPNRIDVNPAGWSNADKTNDRTHLVGYQFSGINSDPRNLVTATAYLNRGVEKKGSSDTNPDGMLFYEQQLDSWMRKHPNDYLDLYVVPNYTGDNLVPDSITMTWVGLSENGEQIEIPTGGHSTTDGNVTTVTLQNRKK